MNKALLFLILVVAGCKNYDQNKEGISTGHLKIGVDNSYSLMMDSEVFTFGKIYKHANVQAIYKPEAEVVQDLLNDSIQAAVICRPLTQEELDFFAAKKRFPESVKVAVDAVALIVHPERKDTILNLEQIKSIFTGQSKNWKDLGGDGGDLKVVFDNNKSCNARSVKEKFCPDQAFPANCFALNSNEEVINYVNSNKDAIGVISVSWISDQEDPTSQEFLDKIKVIRIIDPANTVRPEMARGPFQAYIADQTYPLRRDVYAIRTGLKGSLGTGFVSFIAGEKGQLIIHKMGMVAATAPSRTIRITE